MNDDVKLANDAKYYQEKLLFMKKIMETSIDNLENALEKSNNANCSGNCAGLQFQLEKLYSSRSWKFTKPLRKAAEVIRSKPFLLRIVRFIRFTVNAIKNKFK